MSPALRRLARLYGIQPAYQDAKEQRQEASDEALLAALRALGAPLASASDAPGALRERWAHLLGRTVEPVIVAWNDRAGGFALRTEGSGRPAVEFKLQLESGEVAEWRIGTEAWRGARITQADGARYACTRVELPRRLPLGRHRLQVSVKGKTIDSTVLSAPAKAYGAPPKEGQGAAGRRGARGKAAERFWGAFLPLYALRSPRSWGVGTFGDLRELADWVDGLGGDYIATLPLLASFLDEPFEPSPYAPVSRLFWNELFIDVPGALEEQPCEPVARLLSSASFQERTEKLRDQDLVDYRRAAEAQRKALEPLADCFYQGGGGERDEFRHFLHAHPEAEAYAGFRATVERRREVWHRWPERLRNGELQDGDFAPGARDYHLFVQWLADRQLGGLAQTAGAELYLDLPLGVHPDGFDTWSRQELFAAGTSVGAPPDLFFSEGQDWGFPPLIPDRSREEGHAYFAACIRHHMRYAGMLRLDHVMALHRLYWVPAGLGSKEGVYVRYPAEELYAVLALESHRHSCRVVGEDLGTVPPAVRNGMERHGVHRMYVVQFEVQPNGEGEVNQPWPGAVASLNTHDLPPFAALWSGADLELRHRVGSLPENQLEDERRSRRELRRALTAFLRRRSLLNGRASPRAALRATLRFLAASAASVVLVNLEDLWLEERAQNLPGTTAEVPNWRQKASRTLEQMKRRRETREVLEAVDTERSSEHAENHAG